MREVERPAEAGKAKLLGLEKMRAARGIFAVAGSNEIPLAVFLSSGKDVPRVLSSLEGHEEVAFEGRAFFVTKSMALLINKPRAGEQAVYFGKGGESKIDALALDASHRELRLAARVGLIIALRGAKTPEEEAAILAKATTYKISAAYFTETQNLLQDLPDGATVELRGTAAGETTLGGAATPIYDGIAIVAP